MNDCEALNSVIALAEGRPDLTAEDKDAIARAKVIACDLEDPEDDDDE